ncbi:MAG: 5'-nucleotidase C-terminal domain-containing protein [Prevotella sp.]
MNYRNLISIAVFVLLMFMSCTGGRHSVVQVSGTRLLVDAQYDNRESNEIKSFIAPYQEQVDKLMSPVVGRASEYMYADRPESLLSNLLADILLWSGTRYGENVDFAVYNMGGIRASLAKGNVTYGDVLDMAPFENKLCFLTLKGSDVLLLFRQIATTGGEAVSKGVQMEITGDGKLLSVKLNGEEIDASRPYRIATLDYLSQGNDKMEAFKQGYDLRLISDKGNSVRDVIVAYMKDKLARNEELKSSIEGRIVVK